MNSHAFHTAALKGCVDIVKRERERVSFNIMCTLRVRVFIKRVVNTTQRTGAERKAY